MPKKGVIMYNYDDPEPVKEAQPDGNANNQQYVQWHDGNIEGEHVKPDIAQDEVMADARYWLWGRKWVIWWKCLAR